MSEKNVNVIKDISKGLIKGLTFGSVLDPDMNDKKVEETREFTTKEVFDHQTGKEKLSDEAVEALKRNAKYNGSL